MTENANGKQGSDVDQRGWLRHRTGGRPPEGTREAFEAAVPMGRFARPKEVANVVAHLTSAEASYTDGNVYLIDGGSSAGHMNGRGLTGRTGKMRPRDRRSQ